MKVAYGFGLRRTEAAMLDTVDFAPNPHGPESGDYGVCQVPSPGSVGPAFAHGCHDLGELGVESV